MTIHGLVIIQRTSLFSVVQEIARQIDHFTHALVGLRLLSVALKSPLLSNQNDFCHNI